MRVCCTIDGLELGLDLVPSLSNDGEHGGTPAPQVRGSIPAVAHDSVLGNGVGTRAVFEGVIAPDTHRPSRVDDRRNYDLCMELQRERFSLFGDRFQLHRCVCVCHCCRFGSRFDFARAYVC